MTRRYAWVLLAWLFLAAPADAQPVDSGNITANSSGGGCTVTPPACVVVTFSNQLITTITLQVSGTYTGTTAFEATSSPNPLATSAVWFAVTATNLADGSSATGTTSGQTGQFSIPNSGLMGVRVRATAAWTGTAVVSAVRGYAVAWRLSPFFTRVYTGDGTAALPAKSYFSDTDLGSYRIGANNEGFSAGGTLRWDYNTTRILSTIPFQAPDGDATTPGLAFSGDTDTGVFRGASNIGFSVNGVERARVRASEFYVFGTSASLLFGDSSDVILVRDTANTLAQRNGTNEQQLSIYGSYTSSTDHSKIYIRADTSDATAYFFTENGSGGGTALAPRFGSTDDVAVEFGNDGGGVRWSIRPSAGSYAIFPQASNSYDLCGASNLCRTAYIGTSVISPLFRSDSAKVLIRGTGTGATQLAATQTTVPTCSSNCGTDPVVAGSDTFMTVTMGTSGSPASGWVVTFNGTWAAAPSCTVQMAKAGMAVGKLALTAVTTTTTITVVTNGTAPATTDMYHIHCGGLQ